MGHSPDCAVRAASLTTGISLVKRRFGIAAVRLRKGGENLVDALVTQDGACKGCDEADLHILGSVKLGATARIER